MVISVAAGLAALQQEYKRGAKTQMSHEIKKIPLSQFTSALFHYLSSEYNYVPSLEGD